MIERLAWVTTSAARGEDDDEPLALPALAEAGVAARIAVQAIADLRRMPLERFDMVPLLDRVWELRENLTAYDATFVALAEAFDAVLVTVDERLAKSTGPRCGSQVIAPA